MVTRKDRNVFRIGLRRTCIDSTGRVLPALAELSKLNRENMYRLDSREMSNPRLTSLNSGLILTLGLKVVFKQRAHIVSKLKFEFMPKKVRIPTPLRKLTNNEELVEVNAATIGEAIIELQSRYPGIQERLVDEKGEVRRFVNVYVNEEDIRFLKNKQTPLKDGDEISIIPAIAGG